MAADLATSASKRNRTRSPSYPYLDLAAALEKAAVLWRAEGRHAASVSVVMQHWGYKEESSTGYSCIAALKKFGLVDHDGIGESRQIRLSSLALRILLDADPQSGERRAALRDAALGPRIHTELWERYGVELPSDPSLKRFLVLERSFNEAVVDELLAEYKQTMAFAGLARAGGDGAAAAVAGIPGANTTAVAIPGAAVPTGGEGFREAFPRSQGPPAAAAAPSPRAAGPVETSRPNVPQTQRDLFGERRAAGGAGEADEFANAREGFEVSLAEEAAPMPRAALSGRREDVRPEKGFPAPAPMPVTRRELPVPLDNGMVARVPYPMNEEDFALLIDTLQLWKKRLVQAPPP